jgi:hypothetical protein
VTDILAAPQVLEDLVNSGLFLAKLLHLQRLSTASGLLLQALEGLLDELDILDSQLFTDDNEITDGINVTLDVNDFRIIEASDDLEDGIDSTDVRQERVTKTSTSRGTASQTSNIIDGQVGRNLRLGLVVLAEPVESLIGNDDLGLLRVDGGIRKVGGVTKVRLGDGLEECGLAHVGKTDLSWS